MRAPLHAVPKILRGFVKILKWITSKLIITIKLAAASADWPSDRLDHDGP